MIFSGRFDLDMKIKFGVPEQVRLSYPNGSGPARVLDSKVNDDGSVSLTLESDDPVVADLLRHAIGPVSIKEEDE